MPEHRRRNAPECSTTAESRDSTPPPVNRRVEVLLALAILVCGGLLRYGFSPRMGIDHFDEGVYASQVPPGPLGHSPYPRRYLYAPPLVPFVQRLASATTSADRAADWAAPNMAGALAGLLTLVALWRLARSWFGPLAGLCTLALAATSDFHGAFSRTALTDPWLLLWLILAVAFLERALRRRTLPDLLAAALFTGLAWWTKYNGWLPLAIGAAGWLTHACAERLFPDAARDAKAREAVASTALVSLFGVFLVAGIFFYAQIYLLHADGHGYSEISANHRKYLVGLAGWGPSSLHQFANIRWFDGPATLLVGPCWLVLIGAICSSRGHAFAPVRLVAMGAAVLTAAAAAASCGSFPILFAMTVAAIVLAILRPRATLDQLPLGIWPVCLLAAWFLGLAVSTPFYHPYARLALPLLAATWLGAGWLAARLFERLAASQTASPSNQRMAVASASLLVLLVLAAASGPRIFATGVPAWQDRTSLRRASEQLFEEVHAQLQQEFRDPRPEAVFLTYGEPAVYHALSRLALFQYADELVLIPTGVVPRETIDRPLLVIAGPHSVNDADLLQATQRGGSPRLELVARKSFQPSDILLLDQADPRTLDRRSPPAMELRCYRVR